MKKKSKKTLNNEALERWSAIVKTKAGFKCELCGSTEGLNSHHVISSHILSTRYDDRNGVCTCKKHHKFCKYYSAHSGSLGFQNWFRLNREKDFYYLLAKLPVIKRSSNEST
jgi:hypothetical protein